MKELKTKNPKLKTMISLANYWNLNNNITIKTFVDSTVEFVRNNSLDGVELFLYEYQDQINFRVTIELLRAAFNLNNLTLCAYVTNGTGT